MKACMGKVLFVDLAEGTFEERAVEERLYELFLGGPGVAAAILYNEIPAGADPLGPDNILGFTSGLLTGTGSVMTGRWMAVCKSPLTGGWGDANCGGNLSPAIKQCGYDAIFFRGISEKPVCFIADEGGPRLEDASHLWGKDTIESEEILKAEYTGKKRPAVAVIGPAAEGLSLISGISNDSGRFAARSGVGAVMGSKRLKALVLAGRKQVSCADREGVKALSKEFSAKVRKQNLPRLLPGAALPALGKVLGLKQVIPIDAMLMSGIFKKWGTIYNNTAGMVNGDSPVLNWGGSNRDFPWSRYRKLNPDRIIRRETAKYHCYSCVIGCGGKCNIEDLVPGSAHSHKPEYETVCAFGPLAGNDDLDSIYVINDICNRSGLDTISAGNTVAFAVECFEKGILTTEDTGGLRLNWGNSKAIIELVRRMAAREGIGDILADGTKAAAARIGKGSEEYAVNIGGQEPGMHDPRMDPLMGLHFAADPTPGRHTIGCGLYYMSSHLWERVSWAPPVVKIYPREGDYRADKTNALKSVANSCYKNVVDAAGGCLFAMILGIQHWKIFDFLNRATGWERTADDYMEAGRRIHTLRQLFSLRHGVDPRKVKLHPRPAGSPPLDEGPLAGRTVPIDGLLAGHWDGLGWDRDSGVPRPEEVRSLKIDTVCPEVLS